MTERPAWLTDEPDIQALLHMAIDRFDAQPAAERQRAVFIAVEKHVPALARNNARADEIWDLIRDLEAMQLCTVRLGKPGPYDPAWTNAKLAFASNAESILRDWLQRPSRTPAMQSWRNAVEAHGHAFAGDRQLLLDRRIVIAGRTDAEVVAALARASGMAGPVTLRQLSSQLFWGDSKVLDERGELIASLFPQLLVRDRPIVVAVHLPVHRQGVLFIENQDSYALAASGAISEAAALALVYAAGFRGSASRIRTRDGALLHYAASSAGDQQSTFEAWWYGASGPAMSLWFWGDLDFAGMQILKALRARFGDVQAWRPGYEPMLAALQSGAAHSNAMRGQVDPFTTGCAYADEVLLPAIRRFGCVDQETFVAGA